MNHDAFEEILDGDFQLTSRPEPIPGDLRRGWGITLILMMLYYSNGRRASLQKLHFLAYAARTEHSRALVQDIFDGVRNGNELIVRIEPWVNRALAFARGSSMIELKKGKSAQLTAQGAMTVTSILADESVLAEERIFLERVSRLATEDTVTRLMKAKS